MEKGILVFIIVAAAAILLLTRMYRKSKKLASDILKRNRELDEMQRTMTIAIDVAKMFYFEYFPDLHKAKENNGREEMGVDEWMENYPDSWFEKHITVPEDEGILREAFHKVDAGISPVYCDVRNMIAGSMRWHHYTFVSIYDAEGKRIKVVCTATDCTLRKEEETVYANHYNMTMHMNPNVLTNFHVNLTRNTVIDGYSQLPQIEDLKHCSNIDECYEMTKKIINPEGKVIGDPLFERDELLKAFESGKVTMSRENKVWITEERHEWLKTTVEMFRNPTTGDVEAILYSKNVNREHISKILLEEIAKDNYDRVAYVNYQTGNYMIYRDKNGFHGIERKQFFPNLENYLEKVVVGEEKDRVIQACKRKIILAELKEKKNYDVIFSSRGGSGEIRRKRISFSLMEEYSKLFYAQYDITDIYELEEKRNKELSEALDAAEEANRAKTDFLSRMSHDIRTPLNGIIGMTELALEEENLTNIHKDLDKIKASSSFLKGLINDILDMSKIESGSVTLNPKPYPFDEFLSYMEAVILPLCREKKIQFFADYNLWSKTLIVDKMRFNQIYFNLLSNAIKYTPEGGSIWLMTSPVSETEDEVTYHISVRDTGIGMSTEFMNHLFEPFSQEERMDSSRSGKGTGLGLAIVKQIVDIMGGSIHVDSKIDGGSEFVVTLTSRYYTDDQEPNQENISEDELLKKDFSGKHILLCEDNDLNAEIAMRVLQKNGFEVQRAEDGQIGISQFEASEEFYFDAVLMDIRMPKVDGIAATQKIRGLDRNDARKVPILAMTANAFSDDETECLQAGMNGHLSKPIDRILLLRALNQVISN